MSKNTGILFVVLIHTFVIIIDRALLNGTSKNKELHKEKHS